MALTKLTFKKKGEVADEQPKETLADKTKGFKFKLPAAQPNSETVSDAQPEKQQGRTLFNAKPDKQNANKLSSLSKKEPEVEVQSELEKAPNSIPRMSDDKYEVVVGASDTFTDEAGDKFQEQLGILKSAIDGVGDLRDVMQNVLNFLDDNPQYKDNISPKDVSVFVAACRKVAGITVTEKKARVTKKKTSSVLESDIMADLANLDLDLGL